MSFTLAIILSSIFLGYFYNKITKKNEEDLMEMKRRIQEEFDQKLREEHDRVSYLEYARKAREENEREELIRKERMRQFWDLKNKNAYFESDEVIWGRINEKISIR